MGVALRRVWWVNGNNLALKKQDFLLDYSTAHVVYGELQERILEYISESSSFALTVRQIKKPIPRIGFFMPKI